MKSAEGLSLTEKKNTFMWTFGDIRGYLIVCRRCSNYIFILDLRYSIPMETWLDWANIFLIKLQVFCGIVPEIQEFLPSRFFH